MKLRFAGLTVYVVLSALASLQCSKSPEALIQLGAEAMAAGETQQALEYYTRAYETSLDDEYYFFDRDESYDSLAASADGNILAALQRNEFKKHSTVYIYNIKTGESWSKTIPEVIRNYSLSPSGEYLVISSQEDDKCNISIWSIPQEQKFPFLAKSECNNAPAISNSGKLLFLLDGKIATYDIHTSNLEKEYINKEPEPPVKGMPAWAWFQYSPSGVPFLTFGSAGVYKLYSLKDRELQMITRDGATGKLYFDGDKNAVGIITGGADNHRVVFYSIPDFTITGNLPVKYWVDIAFAGNNRYYYVEEGGVLYHNESGDTELPFFASQILITSKGNLAVFNAKGKIYKYTGNIPGELTKEAYRYITELKE